MTPQTDHEFIDVLMAHILECTKIPKVQIERAVGPILGFFIDQLLSKALGINEIVTLSPEFPIKGQSNNQSTNIDWLLYNKTQNQMILLELKTCDTSFRDEQKKIYTDLQERIRNNSAQFLVEDIKEIKRRSQEHGKYEFVLEKLETALGDYNQVFANCSDAQIIYLMPESSKAKVVTDQANTAESPPMVLCFNDLSETIDSSFNEQWKIIRNHLIRLDSDTRRNRNNQPEVSERDNFQGQWNFVKTIEQCQSQGDDIVIGYKGGATALRAANKSHLKKRMYKWDVATDSKGSKDGRNWIKGSEFLTTVKAITQ